jgi:hypothetical protein
VDSSIAKEQTLNESDALHFQYFPLPAANSPSPRWLPGLDEQGPATAFRFSALGR